MRGLVRAARGSAELPLLAAFVAGAALANLAFLIIPDRITNPALLRRLESLGAQNEALQRENRALKVRSPISIVISV